MTEKRFVYIEHKGADYILDSPNWDLDYIEMLGDTLEAEEIVDLLNEQDARINELEKENEQLKQQLKECSPKKNDKIFWSPKRVF